MKYCLIILLCLLVLFVKKDNNSNEYNCVDYSFFVAGHVYGIPGHPDQGIYHLFKDKFDYIKNDSRIKFGILTGDIVREGTSKEWDEVDRDIAELSIPVYFTLGNHDCKNRELYIERYGKTYYSFTYKNDLYVILDPNIDNWNISGDQLEFLKQLISDINPSVKNVFVFFHQLLWWSPDNKYKRVKPNSLEGRSAAINFWDTVEPLFANLSCSVVMFAGDVGGASWSADYMYDRYNNVTFIASGMGEGAGDNFLIVDVMTNNSVGYRLISLNCEDINCLGKLEEFTLP